MNSPLFQDLACLDERAWDRLGLFWHSCKELERAEACFLRGLATAPSDFSLHFHLGNLCSERGLYARASSHYQVCLGGDPASAILHNNLGWVLQMQCLHEEALEHYGKALQLAPEMVLAHLNRAHLQLERRQLEEAVLSARAALRAEPHNQAALSFLEQAIAGTGQSVQAPWEQVAWDPRFWNDLGGALYRAGETVRAIRCFDEARACAALRPVAGSDIEPVAHSNSLLLLNYLPIDRELIYARHVEWGIRHALRGALRPARPVRARPRIGFLSGDFSDHPVARFMLPIFRHLDRSRFSIYCYSNSGVEDEYTGSIRSLSDRFVSIAELPDESALRRIESDQLDLLIDLSGHTGGNRLRLLTGRPAPLQATYLGYPNTTGLREIDFRITCEEADPRCEEGAFCREVLLRVEPLFLCFEPPAEAPPIGPPPVTVGRPPTFGALCNAAKITDDVVATWSQLLSALPGSRLLLKERLFSEADGVEHFVRRFSRHGIERDRLIFRGRGSAREHLSTFQEVDLCLDPFPYNGTTLSFESLWMGVPFVSLSGDRHAGRMGRAILRAAGLSDFVASGRREYVEVAAAAVTDAARLHSLRRGMRARLVETGLCDGRRFAGIFEGALSTMLASRR